jgi:hypothetical protein
MEVVANQAVAFDTSMLTLVPIWRCAPSGSEAIPMCLKCPAGSAGQCNTRLQFTRRGFKAQGLSRALIEAQRYLVEIGLRVDG